MSVRMVGLCLPTDMWEGQRVLSDKLGPNQTLWEGPGVWAMQQVMARLKNNMHVVTNLDQSTGYHPLLNTIRLRSADVAPVDVVLNEGRFQYLDFSHPTSFSELVIISKKQNSVLTGDIVTSLGDRQSFLLFVICPVVTFLLMWMAVKIKPGERNYLGFSSVLFLSFGILLGQTQYKSLKVPMNHSGSLLKSLLNLTGFFIITLYGGMFISKLMGKTKLKNIDSFEDLIGTDIKIIIRGGNFVEDFFNQSESRVIAQVRDKLDIRRWSSGDPRVYTATIQRILSDVLIGQHVYVDDLHNFEVLLESIKIGVTVDNFHFSAWRDQAPAGWIFPKNTSFVNGSSISRSISSALLYLQDLGMLSFLKKIQLDRVYRHFEPGLVTSQSQTARCSGYLKDRSVSLNFISALVKQDQEENFEPELGKDVKLSLLHLKSAFLMLLVFYSLAFVVFVLEIVLLKCKQYRISKENCDSVDTGKLWRKLGDHVVTKNVTVD